MIFLFINSAAKQFEKCAVLFFLVVFFSIYYCNNTYSQSVVVFIDENNHAFIHDKKISEKTINKSLSKIVKHYLSEGFLSFSVDTIMQTNDTTVIKIFKGRKYNNSFIKVDKEEFEILSQINCKKYVFNNKLNFENYQIIAEKTIKYFENRGFPFVSVFLDSSFIDDSSLNAKLKIEKNQYISFDSIIVKGSAKLSKSYLYPYLELKRKGKYNESIMKLISKKIANISFATEILPAGIEFINNKAYLYLFLDKVKNNIFDGYVGLVPVDENSGKVTINGELNLKLNNIFTLGEKIDVMWKAPKKYSQYLKIDLGFPYLLWTPFGLSGNFLLDKRDTCYLNLNVLAGIQYNFKGYNYIKLFFNYNLSSIIDKSIITNQYSSISYGDYNQKLCGVEFVYKKLDNIFNPQKGFIFNISGAAGKVNIKKNSSIDPVIYDNVLLNITRYNIKGYIKGYIPLHKKWTMLLSADVGSIIGNQLLVNELYNLGGFYSLRGFNENSIEASSYAIGLWELRFIFYKRSYFNLFFNGGWYEKSVQNNYLTDTPYGFGLGTALDVKAGLLYFVYALGNQFNNEISFKYGKIHLGIMMNF